MTRNRAGESTAKRLATTALLIAVSAMGLTACTTNDQPDTPRPTPGESSSAATTSPDSPTSGRQNPTPPPSAPEEDAMRIEITIGVERLQATLEDSPASRDLMEQLPLTLDMSDHGGVEKTGALPSALSLDGQPAGADPDPGDVGYYAPGHDLVLYYGDQSYYDGIVVLGKLEDDAATRLAQMDGTVTVRVDRAGG